MKTPGFIHQNHLQMVNFRYLSIYSIYLDFLEGSSVAWKRLKDENKSVRLAFFCNRGQNFVANCSNGSQPQLLLPPRVGPGAGLHGHKFI
jgi:hypothetical protein